MDTVSSGVARGKALGLTASDIGKIEDINVRRCSGKAFTALADVTVELCLFTGRYMHCETAHIITYPPRASMNEMEPPITLAHTSSTAGARDALGAARAAGDDDDGEGRRPGVKQKENGNTLVLVRQFLVAVTRRRCGVTDSVILRNDCDYLVTNDFCSEDSNS
jgi:hypothetical protein